jgi:hypothetical protein
VTKTFRACSYIFCVHYMTCMLPAWGLLFLFQIFAVEMEGWRHVGRFYREILWSHTLSPRCQVLRLARNIFTFYQYPVLLTISSASVHGVRTEAGPPRGRAKREAVPLRAAFLAAPASTVGVSGAPLPRPGEPPTRRWALQPERGPARQLIGGGTI